MRTEILIADERLFPVNQEQYVQSSAEDLSFPTGNSTEGYSAELLSDDFIN